MTKKASILYIAYGSHVLNKADQIDKKGEYAKKIAFLTIYFPRLLSINTLNEYNKVGEIMENIIYRIGEAVFRKWKK